MTGASTGSSERGGPPIDRRWFEQALRSQGFVVEPPDDGPTSMPHTTAVEPSSVLEAGKSPVLVADGPATPTEVPPAGSAGLADERPPVPSALLARIASRGRGVTPDDAEGPDVSSGQDASDGPDASSDTGRGVVVEGPEPDGGSLLTGDAAAVAPIGAAIPFDGVAPWDISVATTATPWVPSSEGPLASAPEPSAPEPSAPEPSAPQPSVGSEPMAVPAPGGPVAPVPPTGGPSVGAPSDVSDDGAAGAPVALRTASPPVGPEAPEGGLWALVGASETTIPATPMSGVVRVVLTVLTAVAILVVVVGSLVLAAQIV